MKTILIVDDSEFTRGIHKQIITALGYTAIEAGSGNEAITRYEKEKPDLVIMDLLMADMDGLEAIKQILSIDPDAKTIICSTDKQTARKDDAKLAGVLSFLTKPVNAEKLKETVNELLTD